jgi:hypothetical protein
MKRLVTVVVVLVVLVVGAAAAGGVLAEPNQGHAFGAKLDGYQETPTLSSAGTGTFSLSVNATGTELSYRLTFEDLSSTATASHIHLGRPGIAGGVAAWLCGGGGKPACPATGGTVSGTIVAADIIGPTSQGLATGDFGALLRAIHSNATYVNVHTATFPAGEIRGAIVPGGGD